MPNLNPNMFVQVLVAMLLVSLVPLGGFALLNVRQTERDLSGTIQTNLSQSAASLVTRVDAWVDLNLRMLEHASQVDAIQSMNAAQQTAYLGAMAVTYEWIYLAFTLDLQGQNIARNDGRDPETFYFGDRGYFQQVIKGQPLGQQMLVGRTSGKPSLVLARPIHASSGNVQGVVAMSAQVKQMSEAVVRTRIGETGFAFLVDDVGRLVAHGSPNVLSEALQDFSDHPAVLHPAGLFVYGEGEERRVAYTQKTGLGWTLVVQQDYQEAFAPLMRSRRLALSLLLLTGLVVVLAALLLSRRMVYPLEHLSSAAENISRGDLQTTLKQTRRTDEIGRLARAIERLKISVAIAVDEHRK